MAIVIEQPGMAGLAAAAGHVIGAAQKAEKEQALAVQRENMMIEVAERRRAEQTARDWDLQKMILNSQQDFAQEQRLKQIDLDKFASAKQWEVEKMTLRSQMDFQQEEQERLKNIQSITNQITTLDKFKDQISEVQYTDKLFELQTSLDNAKAGGNVAMGRLPTGQESLLQGLQKAGVKGQTAEPTTLTPELFTQSAAEGKAVVRQKSTGQIGKMPMGEVAKSVASGEYEIVENPAAPTQRPLSPTQKEFKAIGKVLLPPTRKVSPIAEKTPAELSGRRFGFYF